MSLANDEELHGLASPDHLLVLSMLSSGRLYSVSTRTWVVPSGKLWALELWLSTHL